MSYFGMGYGNIPAASPAEIKKAVEEIADPLVEEKVGGEFDKAEAEGRINDVREFATRNDFPAEGIAGVEYVDKSTDKEYIWDDGEYVLVDATKPITPSDIDSLPAWNT